MSDTIPKSEVARVLAGKYSLYSREMRRQKFYGHMKTHPFVNELRGHLDEAVELVDELNLRPEFESALAALEQKEAGRG